jgi:S-adenosylmethionine:tRNA ribosyltransferase-isomerase
MTLSDLYNLSSYQYDLPEELIAQAPCSPRDKARLMVVERSSGRISDRVFTDLKEILQKGDQLIFNNTKVIPARLLGKRPSGGQAEIFLLRSLSEDTWEALTRPGRKLQPGVKVIFGPDFSCEIVHVLEGKSVIKFYYEGSFDQFLNKYGLMPLPQYIKRSVNPKIDPEQYQTVYATVPGAVAAPTAGLHFTDTLLNSLENKGVLSTEVTLHVSLGTFRPIQVNDIRDHQMHTEQVIISEKAAKDLNDQGRGRKICVGTTSCRAVESAVQPGHIIRSGIFETNIFIYPGYHFKYTEGLLTNFHLPGSSLLMLVSAFAGYDLIREAYAKAIRDGYRFYSYGDAMIIL